MWSRQELKSNARVLMKANYLKVMIVALIFSFLTSSGYNSARGAAKQNGVDTGIKEWAGIPTSLIIATILGVAGIVIIAFLVNVLLSIFIWNPLSVGCIKYFVDCRYGNAELKDILYVFKNNYVNVCVTIFLKELFTFLWSCLLIIPGIVKSYEYKMIPYLLAENPDMSREEAFAESKRMMDGHKWDAFVLDLSFIGWWILGALTLNIVNILFTNPYMYLTSAELYHTLKQTSREAF